MYKTVIDSYVDNGYARRLTPEEAAQRSEKTWIIPHHPVVNINKPGEVRVVNDAAAVFEGASLNTALKTGPDLLNSLIGIIIRFRTNLFAIAADIKAMFHQVRVPEKDLRCTTGIEGFTQIKIGFQYRRCTTRSRYILGHQL